MGCANNPLAPFPVALANDRNGSTASCELELSGNRATGVHRKLNIACSLGITGPASWSSSPTQEDDHGYSNASDALNAATRALEQGQAHRPKASVAAKTCLVDPHPIADGGTDARLGNVQSGNRQQAAGLRCRRTSGRRRRTERVCGRSRHSAAEEDRSARQV